MQAYFLVVSLVVVSVAGERNSNVIEYGDDSDLNRIPVDEKPFKIETDYYIKPTQCQDLETGTFYKIGAEWYSSDPSVCVQMSCRPQYFPEVTVTSCSDYFKSTKPKRACNVKKRKTFPNCCDECKGRQ